ncbi:MAG: peptidylprolyl isomerase [Methylococcales bacterium]|jgi:FKBP-type peptidyl-prolyl cis-trans isomerase SlyD|nr:peptidylprolyl isomerase [Methylococcales bacterium]MBT3507617.1 peptidylprolyl isomerase [Methylococcales bacterium]MBT3699224.1 peptidylprolyl isomerase [Methylococcales bacterium]MBT3815772.1 peptidylprolyl isomerase [Methylococcales bacterium]MBT4032535.1 peptidylprolyl isomerase [Methylococcales bacterium]
MKITENSVVSILYKLSNDAGTILDQSTEDNPLIYLHGQGNIVIGLENALTGKTIGDTLDITVTPDEGYGNREDYMVETVNRSMFEGLDEISIGKQFHAEGNTGPVVVTVTKIEGDEITIDGNHPLAGENLNFAIEVLAIREATEDELTHGHIHGPGCQH